MSHTYNYIFLCSMIDKYENLIREAKTIQARQFAKEQYERYLVKYKLFKN